MPSKHPEDAVADLITYIRNIKESGALDERKRILALVKEEQETWTKDTKMWLICERIRKNIQDLGSSAKKVC